MREEGRRGEGALLAVEPSGGLWRRSPRAAAEAFERIVHRGAPPGLGGDSALSRVVLDAKPMSTRKASGLAINALAPVMPTLVGGSADLAGSNQTSIKNGGDVQRGAYGGRNFSFGVREHAMGSVMNGLALHGGFRPFGGTFLVFSDYMRPAIRLAALMRMPVVYVFTHDSVGLGEDGPTHQPIEHLAALRATPNLNVVRPASANETALAWRFAIEQTDHPTAMALSRQGLPAGDPASVPDDAIHRGAYSTARVQLGFDAGRHPDRDGIRGENDIGGGAADLLEAEGITARAW